MAWVTAVLRALLEISWVLLFQDFVSNTIFIHIYIQYILRNTGVHLSLPFVVVLKVHWLWQKAFQLLPTSL